MTSAEDYAVHGRRSVAGWLAPESARIIAALGRAQTAAGVGGGVAEIGIHHGKLFILLALLRQPGEGALAIDIFARQDLNRDASGQGDKEIFLGHLARFGCDPATVAIIERDSTSISAGEVREAAGMVRLFSVDGGHTSEVVENDLALAEQVLAPGGVVIMDDVYNEAWPEVAEGTFRYLARPDCRLRPFAVSPNKFYLCNDPEHAARFRAQLAVSFSASYWSTVRLFGTEALVFGRETWRSRLKNSPYYNLPAVQAAVRLARGPLAGVIARFRS